MEAKLDAPDGVEVAVVPATDIALDCIGRDIPNAPIAGALAKYTGVIGIENLKDHVEQTFAKKFSEKVVAGNLEAIQLAYEDVIF